jgi:hypothetical protein
LAEVDPLAKVKLLVVEQKDRGLDRAPVVISIIKVVMCRIFGVFRSSVVSPTSEELHGMR